MTPTGPIDRADPLEPLVSTLLDRAQRDARACLDDADADVQALVSRARAEADSMLADARARGAADGAAVVASERARAEREARGVLLQAQCGAHDLARQAARDAVSAMRADDIYPELMNTLRGRASADLGPGATVAECDRGGVVADVTGRRIEYSLDDLADDVMDRLGCDLDELWSP